MPEFDAKTMHVVYVIMGADSPNQMHMSSSENRNMLSNAKRCSDCSKNFAQEALSTYWLQIFNLVLLSDHCRHTSFNVIEYGHLQVPIIFFDCVTHTLGSMVLSQRSVRSLLSLEWWRSCQACCCMLLIALFMYIYTFKLAFIIILGGQLSTKQDRKSVV